MKKVELLAPAGSFEALQAAVSNGCDAVYLGGSMFGARAFANNFDEEEMIKAIAYAHVYGVKVFVTVNTLIKETEIEDCVSYARFLYEHDADALIVQDLGLFSILHEEFPDMELHASTQMHIHNPQGILMMKEAGAARVVVPRETPIEQIAEYAELGIDLEVFVQGALCVSYSGQCLMSAMTLQRSGNRGECAQNCRMQYELEKTEGGKRTILPSQGSYLLSPKDLNTLDMVPELIEAGIASFKIEGRMKRPEYVALMVSLYRQAIDAYEEGRSFHVDEAMKEEMMKIFHRGFTCGHLFHQRGSNLMNPIRPNHIGIEIGSVVKITKDKMSIRLQKPLYQGDGIRILRDRDDEGFRVNRIYHKGLLVNHGEAGSVIELDKTMYVEVGAKVLKTSDTYQLKQLQSTYQTSKRRIPVYGAFHMRIGKPAVLEVNDEEGMSVTITSDMPADTAMKTPLSQERVQAQLQKSKDTPFDFKHIEYHMDAQGILPIKELNRMRRIALEELAEKRKVRYPDRIHRERQDVLRYTPTPQPALCVVVHTKDQYIACKEAGISQIFVEGTALYQELKEDDACHLRTPRVMKGHYTKDVTLIQEAGGLAQDYPCICDTSLNVTNSYTVAYCLSHHAQGVALSLENSLEECINIAKSFQQRYGIEAPLLYPVYGRTELMLSEYCPINAVIKDSDKKNCNLCRGSAHYALVDKKQQRYPIMTDEYCRMHLLEEEPRNRIKDIEICQEHGIQHFLCVFTMEPKEECESILQAITRELSSS